MAVMGRPKIEIDPEQFEKLCSLCATLVDIAGWFNCSEDTIERFCKREYEETFAEVFKKKSAKGRVSLRRKQMEVALNGNVTMLIWLGKQFLGQADKTEEYIKAQVDHSDEYNAYVDKLKKAKQILAETRTPETNE